MSQYPYQPPQHVPYGYGSYGQDPMSMLLAPARRASIVMFILGGLMLPCGGLFALVGTLDFSQLSGQQSAQIQAMEQQLSGMGMTLKQLFVVMGTSIAIPGLLLLVLGAMVRGGGMGSVVTAIIFCGLLGLLAGLGMIANLVQGQVCGVGMFLVALSAVIVAEIFLFQAAGRAGQVAAYRSGGMGAYPPGYGQQQYSQQQQGYPSQQPQSWQQPGGGQWGPQQGWGQQQQQYPPPPPPPMPPPPSDRQG